MEQIKSKILAWNEKKWLSLFEGLENKVHPNSIEIPMGIVPSDAKYLRILKAKQHMELFNEFIQTRRFNSDSHLKKKYAEKIKEAILEAEEDSVLDPLARKNILDLLVLWKEAQ
jgi:hypothetical protein